MDTRVVRFDEHRRAIGRLRADVWTGVGFEFAELQDGLVFDAFESNSIHWCTFQGEEIVGSARLTIAQTLEGISCGGLLKKYLPEVEMPVAYLSRLVVAEAFRGHGLAKTFDTLRIEAARSAGVKTIFGIFPLWRRVALERLGFHEVHLVSQEDYVAHDSVCTGLGGLDAYLYLMSVT